MFNSSKAIQDADLSVKLLKDNGDSFGTKYLNSFLKSAKFPYWLKLASVTPVSKKNARTYKSNYILVGRLTVISKIFKTLFVTNFPHIFSMVSVRAVASIDCL